VQTAADPTPWARAVVRDGRVTLNAWAPSLMTGGPVRAMLRELPADGVVIADLLSETRDDGREELIVRWVPDGRTSGPATAAVLRWAERVGYRRVWLPDAVVDFSGALPTAGRVATACPTCGACWDDESPEFWTMVRQQGCFPGHCPICNGSLPEWEPAVGLGAAIAAPGGIGVQS
jgi:hypothetical protein